MTFVPRCSTISENACSSFDVVFLLCQTISGEDTTNMMLWIPQEGGVLDQLRILATSLDFRLPVQAVLINQQGDTQL